MRYDIRLSIVPPFSEYCGKENKKLEVTAEEIPKESMFDYMLSPATVEEEEKKEDKEEVVQKVTPGIIVYCIDISGSMDSKADVPELQGEIPTTSR